MITWSDVIEKYNEDQLALMMNPSPHYVDREESIEVAAKMMYENRLRRLPVVTGDRKVRGVITPQDLLKVLPELRSTEKCKDFMRRSFPLYDNTPLPVVQTIMGLVTSDVYTVLNKKSDITGLVARHQLYNRSLIEPEVAQAEFGLDIGKWSPDAVLGLTRLHSVMEGTDLPSIPVRRVMEKVTVKAQHLAPLEKAARTMTRKKVHHLAVVDRNEMLKGVLWDLDMMRSIYHRRL